MKDRSADSREAFQAFVEGGRDARRTPARAIEACERDPRMCEHLVAAQHVLRDDHPRAMELDERHRSVDSIAELCGNAILDLDPMNNEHDAFDALEHR